MVVQHNMQAMNANRMLGITAGQQAKSTEKLSSGYKINRAADNAAGLAISEKMRKQIRGLDQASSNAQDGISAVQTAEGALNEVQDMLQRMNELAVQSANGTNSTSDRKSIQDEIDQLATEIDRVSETTKFNEAYLLKGDANAPKKYSFSYGPIDTASKDPGECIDMTGEGWGTASKTDEGTTLALEITGLDPDDEGKVSSEDMNAVLKSLRDQGFTVSAEVILSSDGTTGEVSYTLGLNGEAAKNYSINRVDNTGAFQILNTKGDTVMELTVSDTTLAGKTELTDVGQKSSCVITASAVKATKVEGEVARVYDKDGNAISANSLKDYFTGIGTVGDDLDLNPKAGVKLYDAVGNVLYMDDIKELIKPDQNLVGDLQLKLHVGADATKNNQITINLQAMSAKGLGVNGLKVDGSDDSNALDAIETIKSALATVSAQRSELGAAQNRLEHTIANLDNIVENTTSAESSIRDTDMAEEMVKYSKSNILAQAGQSMLAQANQSNQGVLSLLG